MDSYSSKTGIDMYAIQKSEIEFTSIADIKIGLLAISTDVNSEHDIRLMIDRYNAMNSQSIHLFTSRVENQNPVTLENLKAMENTFVHAIKTNVPNLNLDALIYSCTAASLAIGSKTLYKLVLENRADVIFSNPILAILAAFKSLNIKKLNILNPYSLSINEVFIDFLTSHGFAINKVVYMDLDSDIDMTSVSPQCIADMAIQYFKKDDSQSYHSSLQDEALFISCTALRSTAVIEQIEEKIQMPVITSSQAMVWHVLQSLVKLRKLDIEVSSITGFGQLFQNNLID